MNCTVVQLKEYANDENTAWEVRQTAKYMLTNPDKAWNEVKDRAHGKARQTDTIEHTGRIITGFDFV
jgi:hypothetical protein